MKKSLKHIFVFVLIIYLVTTVIPGFDMPNSFVYLVGTLLILAFTMMLVCPLLNFLTIKCQFPTFFLMSSILMMGVLYVLKMFMTDFYINEFEFAGLDIGSMVINSFMVTPIISIAVVSVLSSLLGGIYRELDGN